MKVLLSFFMMAMVISTVSVAAKPSFLTRAKARLQHAAPLAEVKEHVGKVVQVTALTALLFTAPIVGHASDTGSETSLAISSVSDTDVIDPLSHVHFSGGITLGHYEHTSSGLMFNIDQRDYYRDAVRKGINPSFSGISFGVHVEGERHSLHQWLGRPAYNIYGESVAGFDAFDTPNGKVSSLLFMDISTARHRVSGGDSIIFPSSLYTVERAAVDEKVVDDAPNYYWGTGIFGVGGEFRGDPLFGQSANIQLRAGFGMLVNDQLLPYEQRIERVDTHFNFVGALKFIVKTDGATFGDMLGKEQSSRWHWLPLVPKGKVSASLYKPVFDGGDEHSGDVRHSLQVHLKVGGPVYLVFDRYDSPNFDKPYKKMSFQFQPFSRW